MYLDLTCTRTHVHRDLSHIREGICILQRISTLTATHWLVAQQVQRVKGERRHTGWATSHDPFASSSSIRGVSQKFLRCYVYI